MNYVIKTSSKLDNLPFKLIFNNINNICKHLPIFISTFINIDPSHLIRNTFF